MATQRVPSTELTDRTVGDVMIPRPKTLPGDASVGDVRRAFEDPSNRTVVLADGQRFVGALNREDVPDAAGDAEAASRYAQSEPVTATPGMPIPAALELLTRAAEPRVVVLADDGATLVGLLCFNRNAQSFCTA